MLSETQSASGLCEAFISNISAGGEWVAAAPREIARHSVFAFLSGQATDTGHPSQRKIQTTQNRIERNWFGRLTRHQVCVLALIDFRPNFANSCQVMHSLT